MGGRYKSTDNLIEEVDSLGLHRVQIQPLPVYATPESMDELCITFFTSDGGRVIVSLLQLNKTRT